MVIWFHLHGAKHFDTKKICKKEQRRTDRRARGETQMSLYSHFRRKKGLKGNKKNPGEPLVGPAGYRFRLGI